MNNDNKKNVQIIAAERNIILILYFNKKIL